MKTVKLRNFGTIHYGSPEELEEAANSKGIKLPSMKTMNLDCCWDGSGHGTNLFLKESKFKEEDVKKVKVVLLSRLLCEVSGDDVTEKDCFELSTKFYRDMDELRMQLLY